MKYIASPSSQIQTTASVTSVLSPQTWPFSLDFLPQAAYLVGGNVRDALMGRQAEYLDLDFVLPCQAVETARAIAVYYRAGFVLLDPERQIARVVFEKATVDFAQQVGATLESDLYNRDFTVNAIAYSPHTHELIDPVQGYIDLQRQLIRMIAPENLKEDPLRLLRAYRQSAQLGFELEPETQETICHLADLLQEIAAERIQAELNYLLSTPRGTSFLTTAYQDGLLQFWLPHATDFRMERLAQVDQAAIALAQACPVFAAELHHWLRDQQKISGASRSWLKIAKLACLVAPDLELAEQELWRLKYSRAEIQAVLTTLKCLPQLQSCLTEGATAQQLYTLFRGIGAAFPALAVLAVGTGIPVEAIVPLIERFLTPDDPIAHNVPLLTGRDLMKTLKLPPSPQIGNLLEAIQLAQAEGKVGSRTEAIQFAQSILEGK